MGGQEMKRRLGALVVVTMMLMSNAVASAKYAVAPETVEAMPGVEAASVAGGSWWGCVGWVATVTAAVASGGIGGGILGLLASLGFSVATVCECAPYLDELGFDFQEFCGSAT